MRADQESDDVHMPVVSSSRKGRAQKASDGHLAVGPALTDVGEAQSRDGVHRAGGLTQGSGKSQATDDNQPYLGRSSKKRRAQIIHDDQVDLGPAEGREEGIGMLKAIKQVESFSLPDLQKKVSEIVEQWKRRQAWHKAEKSLTLQAKAILRRLCGGDKEEAGVLYKAVAGKGEHDLADIGLAACFPILEAKKIIMAHRKPVEKRLAELADGLPGTQLVKETPGLSLFSLAAIMGECPGVSMSGLLDFGTVQRVWKRCGLAVGEDGTRQRKVAGAEAIKHGYNPARRAVIWTIGDSLVKIEGPYRDLYLRYKAQEEEKANQAGIKVVPAEAMRNMKEEERRGYISKGHVNSRAKRKMEKELLKHLWVIWHKAEQ